MENNVPAEVALLGDLKSVAEQVHCHCLVEYSVYRDLLSLVNY